MSQQIVIGDGKRLRLERKSDSIVALGFIVGLFPVLILLASGVTSKLNGTYEWLVFVNRLAALVGTSMLMLHLILVARVPWIEKVFGLDRLTGAHKRLSKPVMYVLAIHVFASVFASSIQDQVNLWDSLIHIALSYPEMIAATAGFTLMIIVMFSSIQIARRNLKYEVWYLIHLTAYIAVMLAIPHQLVFGTDFLAEPVLAVYFIALYVFTLVNVVWFRSLSAVVRSYRMGLRVSKVIPAGNNSTSVYVSGKNIQGMGVKSGQFFMFRIMTLRDFWRPHPFSVSSSANEDFIRFTIGDRGDDTSRIKDLKVGTKVVLEGPYGVFTEVKRTKQKVTLFAGGIGIAPIRSLAKEMVALPGDLTIIYRVNSEKDAALAEELREISDKKGYSLHLLIGERSSKTPWLPKQLGDTKRQDHVVLTELAPDILDSDIYICGPTPWVDSLGKTLGKLTIPRNQIHVEEFAW